MNLTMLCATAARYCATEARFRGTAARSVPQRPGAFSILKNYSVADAARAARFSVSFMKHAAPQGGGRGR
jgi:hypothetical protein